jgi:hypothetical protein
MIRQVIKGTFGIAFFLTFVAIPAYAKVAVDQDFKGSLLITGPDGNVSMLEQGEKPSEDIPAESVVEVFLGEANVSSGTDEKASVACLGTEAAMAGDSGVSLSCGENSGVLKVVKGSVTLTDAQGKLRTLSAGEEYPIQARGNTAPPTAETENRGLTSSDADLPPPDSRNIEASPSL